MPKAKPKAKQVGGNRGWSTGNELTYLRGLLTGEHFRGHDRCDHVCAVSPEQLLKNYIASAKRRKAWGTFGEVEPDVVIEEASRLLQGVGHLEAGGMVA